MFDNLSVMQKMILEYALTDRYYKCKRELDEMKRTEHDTTCTSEQIKNAYKYSVNQINDIVDMLQVFSTNFSKVNINDYI